MLEALNLECIKGEIALFSGLSFSLRAGEALQVVGVNGGGKTSLLRIICGLSHPEQGEVQWQGTPIAKQAAAFSEVLAYVGHLNALKSQLTALENLQAHQGLLTNSSHTTPWAALAQLGLQAKANVSTFALSAGQKRRLALARLLLCNAPLWVLDEPVTAIDSEGTQKVEVLLQKHLAGGGSLLFTSHQPLALVNATVRTLLLTPDDL